MMNFSGGNMNMNQMNFNTNIGDENLKNNQ